MKSSIYFFLFSFLFLAACEKDRYALNPEAFNQVDEVVSGQRFETTDPPVFLEIKGGMVSFSDVVGQNHQFPLQDSFGVIGSKGLPVADYRGEGYKVAVELDEDAHKILVAAYKDFDLLLIASFPY